ncbi:PREDICTED: uncharacterized protein LOC106817765 [Priapulus caudatus]|uniref:Uncharacterized protein LOC106817765 n=1 Tax=Priapulus caudatus TaxID=37621 RepID=A0ABM1F0I4_PRICU|nr:PREDICTED: uncharacterized protein LOC106817765 [Priapulus caudatus]
MRVPVNKDSCPGKKGSLYKTRLLVQRLRLSSLGCGEAAIATLSDRTARVVNIVHESLSPATMATADATSDGCWDEQLYTVTSANQALAQWRLLCDNLPLLIVGLSRHAEGATGVCDLLVQTIVDDDVTATTDKCVTSPRAVVAVRALQDASLYELAGFQRHIMAAVWQRVRDDATSLVAGSKTCSRKLRDIFDKLQILAGDDREGGDDSSSRVELSEVATLLVEFQTRAASRAGRLSVGMETPAGCRAWQGISTLLESLQVALLSETHLACCFVAAAVALICLPTWANKEASLLGRFTSLMEQTLDLGRPCELLRRSVPEEFFENMRSYVNAEGEGMEYPRLTRFLVKLSMGKAPPGERDGGSTQDSVVQFARRVYTCSPDELRSIVSDLLQQTMQKDAFLLSLPLWEQLLTRHLADAKQKTLLPLLVHVVIATQGLCGSDDPAVICAALHLQTLVLRSTKGVLNFGKTAVLCLHSVARVALADVVAPSSQPPVINAIYELLHELIASHAEGALHAIPSYVHATKKMLFGIMHAGKQTGEPGGQRSAASNEVILCANNVDR